MGWSVAEFPERPQGKATLETIEDAVLTKVQHGPLRALRQPKRWFRGAVHDSDGRLVVSSQKIGGLSGNQWVASDPRSVTVRPGLETLSGTWLYGGHWMQHFGHFITETVTTLWPTVRVDGLVFHEYFRRTPEVQPWQQRLVDLTGYPGLPIRIVRQQALRVDHLLVPARAVVANGWAYPEAREVWCRIVRRLDDRQPRHGRLFLSRTQFNAAEAAEGRPVRSTPARDAALDELFAERDFAVISPELLDVDEQISLAAGARVIAGGSGSALHLSAFAPSNGRVIEIGDKRSPERPVPMQQVLNAVCGHEHAFVPAATPVPRIGRILKRLGL